MAKFRDLARTSVEAPPLSSPLEDKVAYIHHLMRVRAIGQKDVRRNGVRGREVKLALKPMIRDVWHLPEAQLEHLSSDIRQVLKRIGAAVCVSFNQGESPVWFVSDELAADYVAVARYVTTHGSMKGVLEPTRREKQLTAAEAGEDREPAPVEVKNGTPKPKPEEATVVDLTDPNPESTHRDKPIKKSEWLELIKLVFADKGVSVLSGYEIAEALENVTGRALTHIRGVCTELDNDGVLFSRFETNAEQAERYPDTKNGFERGRTIRLYALTKAALKEPHVAVHNRSHPSGSMTAAKKTAKKTAPKAAAVPAPSTPTLDAIAIMVEALVNAEVNRRIGELVKQHGEAVAKANELQRQLDRVNAALGR